MKDVQCCELFGGIALKNHAFSFSIISICFLMTETKYSLKNQGVILQMLYAAVQVSSNPEM